MTRKLRSFILASLCTSAVAAFAPTANANLVLNGDFQAGVPEGGTFEQVNPVDTNPLPNWTVDSGNVDWIHGHWPGSGPGGIPGGVANYSVDLSGFEAQGSISQLLTGLVTGQHYQLTFYTALNPDFNDLPQSLDWSLGTFSGSASGILDPFVGWTATVFDFVWTEIGNTALLTFGSTVTQNCCYGPALDSISVEAVPIPAALPLLVAGLGAVGFLGRRRARKARAA